MYSINCQKSPTGVLCVLCGRIFSSVYSNIDWETLPLCHSHGGAGDEERLALCTALPLLCEGDEDPGLQPAAGVLPLPHPGLHGRSLRCEHRVHWPVSICMFFHLQETWLKYSWAVVCFLKDFHKIKIWSSSSNALEKLELITQNKKEAVNGTMYVYLKLMANGWRIWPRWKDWCSLL